MANGSSAENCRPSRAAAWARSWLRPRGESPFTKGCINRRVLGGNFWFHGDASSEASVENAPPWLPQAADELVLLDRQRSLSCREAGPPAEELNPKLGGPTDCHSGLVDPAVALLCKPG